MRSTPQNQEASLGRANLETGRFADDSRVNVTKLWLYCAHAFAAALLVRHKCKSDRALTISVLDLTSCRDHRCDGALGVIRSETYYLAIVDERLDGIAIPTRTRWHGIEMA